MLKDKVLDILKEGGTVLLLGSNTHMLASELLKALPKPDASELIQISNDTFIHPKGVHLYPVSYVNEAYDRISLASFPCIIYNDTTPENMSLPKTKYIKWLCEFLTKVQNDYTITVGHCGKDGVLGLSKKIEN